MESVNQQFIEAGTLMIAGMVFVFAFLGILVVFINTVLVPLSKKFPDPQPTHKPKIIFVMGGWVLTLLTLPRTFHCREFSEDSFLNV